MVTVVTKVPVDGQITDQDLSVWFASIASERSQQELKVIRRACCIVAEAYGKAQRKSGESQLLHALSVADILTGLGVDYETITAAILHSVIEDGLVSATQLEKEVGPNITKMVVSVTTMGNLRIHRSLSGANDSALAAHMEGLRKMLLATIQDVRVALIRLADQLHDLRSSRHLPEEQRKEVAQDTLEIYAPLANRLGIGQIKWEMEDLAFRTLEPDTYVRIADLLAERRMDREQYIKEVIQQLQKTLESVGLKTELFGRPKHIYSIWRKMQRKRVGFNRIFDVRAVRMLVPDVTTCYAALGVVHSLWKPIPGEFDDYISAPKDNFYQSLHTAVIGPHGKTLEVQIRTNDMHYHSELGVAAHWRYKEGKGKDVHIEKRIEWMRRLLDWKADGEEIMDFVDDFQSEMVHERVYVFTPTGEIMDLPTGATPLDFAYYVHTDIGHQCRGAKVNGKIVTLRFILHSGDTVEILTSPQGTPGRDWLMPHLGYVTTSRARLRIRQWFKKQDYKQNAHAGKVILENEIQRLGLSKIKSNLLLDHFGFSKQNGLLAAIGRGEISTIQVANALEEQAPPPKTSLPIRPKENIFSQGGVNIQGVGDLLTQMARCCKPVPCDSITGYITRGYGVTIHRQDCNNILKMEGEDLARLIEVDWSVSQEATFAVDIQIEAFDRQNLLRDITAILSSERINVLAMNTLGNHKGHMASMVATLEVVNLGQLLRVLDRIGQLPNVIDSRRKI